MENLKILTLLFITSLSSLTASGANVINASNCQFPNEDEKILYAENFSGQFTLETLKEKEEEIYNSGKRLKARAYINTSGDLVLPHRNGNEVNISSDFIKAISAQVENAFNLGYVDALIFPDMGHSHMMLEIENYVNNIDPLEVRDQHIAYELMLKDKNTKYLYHTAEKIKFFDEAGDMYPDRKIGWRFYTRNILGSGDGSGHIELLHNLEHGHNTSRSENYFNNKKYRYWGAGFNISASVSGCFSFMRNGKKFNYDISLEDLPYESMY
jgi:hypothetical protein